MKAAFAVLLTLCLVACQQDSSELRSRVAVWSQRLTELPAGSSSPEIQRWAASHKVHFTFLSEQRQFYANVERVPVKGLHFPCSEWNIIITVSVDPSGHSTKSSVQQVGACV